jgi:hypothetical protein
VIETIDAECEFSSFARHSTRGVSAATVGVGCAPQRRLLLTTERQT